MDFTESKKIILRKIEELNLPYFKIIVTLSNKEIFSFEKNNYNSSLLTVYSLSKVLTSIAFMTLVQKGLVSPEDPVSKYLKNYSNLRLTSGEEISDTMLVKHLLTMTAGLDYNFNRPEIVSFLNENKEATTSQICETFALDGLVNKPGEIFNYSLCLDVVGGIIEKVSGMSLNEYVKKTIFDPLGLKNSTFINTISNIERTIPDVGFVDGKLIEVPKYDKLLNLSVNYQSGGSGLITTIEDFSKITRALLDGKILSSKYLDMMSSCYVQETPFCAPVQKYSVASFDYGYGYGVRVRKVKNSCGVPIGEFGWDGAAGSYCLIDNKNKISIVMGFNIQNWPDYLKDIHIKIVEALYCDFIRNKLL